MADQAARVGVCHEDSQSHYGFGDGHPFGHDRFGAFWHETCARGLHRRVMSVPATLAPRSLLELFHSRDYLGFVEETSHRGGGYLDEGDTPAQPGIYEAACEVVGATVNAVDGVMQGEWRRAFVPIAGLHHAARAHAAGFCVLDDIGVAIAKLRLDHGIRRIAYVDIDAHHGDGVFYSFEQDPDLLFADLHEDGRFLYPGTGDADETGRGPAAGTKLNIPMPPGADDAQFHAGWDKVEAYLKAGKPEFILFQCGADSIAGDPLTHLQYSPAAHGHAAMRLCRIADEFCQGRIVGMGGGGYNRKNIAMGWNAVLESFLSA